MSLTNLMACELKADSRTRLMAMNTLGIITRMAKMYIIRFTALRRVGFR